MDKIMDISIIIKNSLFYIEQNLKADINVEELADLAGYSVYHYYRLFSSLVGYSVSEYILKRRLNHVLYEIANGEKAIDIVMNYGFDTYGGFYKAFVKLYGCSPRRYLSIYKEPKINVFEVKLMYTIKELRKILQNWNIENNLSIVDKYITKNNVWEIGNEYILMAGERDKIIKNILMTKTLNKYGYSSSVIIPTISGNDYYDGEEIFILTHCLKGKPISVKDIYGNDGIIYSFKYGEGIGKLHKVLNEIQNHVIIDEVNLFEIITKWAMPNVKKQNEQWDMKIDNNFFNDYINVFGKLYNNLSKQLIHRDPNINNILFHNVEVTGFIDFELSEVNIRLFDPCYGATSVLSETEHNSESYKMWLEVLKSIILGYDNENKLTKYEKQAIFYVLCSIQMIFIAYFQSLNKSEFNVLSKINGEMLKFIIENKEYIGNIF